MKVKTKTEANKMLKKQGIDQLYSDTSFSMIDFYHKQLNLAFDFYNTFLNSTMESKSASSSIPLLSFYNLFFNGEGTKKSIFTPFVWMNKYNGKSNPYAETYENFYKKLNEHNKQWINCYQTNYKKEKDGENSENVKAEKS